VSGLAQGAKGYEKAQKAMREKFVFLNVYCTSVKDEHEVRGPKGPYSFQDKSVPVCVIKRWDGHTYRQQLGFGSDAKRNQKSVADWIEKALKENGPVLPPKRLRPLMKCFEKGEAYLTKKRPGYAWKEFAKVLKLGGDRKKFPEGAPSVVAKAQQKQEVIREQLRRGIEAARALSEEKPSQGKAAFTRLMRAYGNAAELKKLIIAERDRKR
jgi:hypothetical protein